MRCAFSSHMNRLSTRRESASGKRGTVRCNSMLTSLPWKICRMIEQFRAIVSMRLCVCRNPVCPVSSTTRRKWEFSKNMGARNHNHLGRKNQNKCHVNLVDPMNFLLQRSEWKKLFPLRGNCSRSNVNVDSLELPRTATTLGQLLKWIFGRDNNDFVNVM